MVVLNKGFIISLSIFLVLFFFLFYLISDNFSYCLDDTYIHMGIAKNFVKFNNWGSSIQGFESSTSSPIWTFLIAIFFFIFGINDFIPLIINFILGIALIISIAHFLRVKFKFKEFESYIYSLLIFLFIPGFVMIFIGMEHLLHIFLTLWFTYFFLDVYFENKNHNLFYLLTLLMGAIRYESLFLLIPINLLFLHKRNFKQIIIFSFLIILPIIIYGLISISNGSDFLPNSILVKGFNGNMEGIIVMVSVLLQIYTFPLLFTFPLLYLLRNHEDKRIQVLLFIISSLIILQTIFASIGWLMRYEAWFLTLFLLTLIILYKQLKKDKQQIYILIILFLFGLRFILGFSNILLVHYQIFHLNVNSGLFLREYYNNKTIVIHDLGGPSYYADVNLIDLNGLATKEIQRERRNNNVSREFIIELTENADVAIVFKNEDILFDCDNFNWTFVGNYTINESIISPEYSTFYIYAIKENPGELKNNFIEFFSKSGLKYYVE